MAWGPLEPLIPVLEPGQTLPQGAGFRCALARAPEADPELSADQSDAWGRSRGQAADHTQAHSRPCLSCMLQRCSDL